MPSFKQVLKRTFPGAVAALRVARERRARRGHFEGAPARAVEIARRIKEIPFPVFQQREFKRLVGSAEARETMISGSVIEINNTCNIDCIMCKTSLSTRQKGMMPKELMDKSVTKVVELGGRDVELHTIGDPLANPRVSDVFEVLRRRGVRTALTTNGLLLYRHADTLLAHMDVCSTISFSVDGATAATYEKMRAGGKWQQLLDNIEIARTKLKPAGYVLRMSIVVSLDTVSEVGAWIERFRSVVDKPHADMSFIFVNSLSPDNAYFEAANLFKNRTYANSPCGQVARPVARTLIDGRVSICCRDYDGSLIIGDSKKNTLAEILSDAPLKKMQAAHEARDVSAYPLCGSCYIIDSRVQDAFGELMSYLLFFHPSEPASFYQEKVDRFVALFQADGEPARLSEIFPAR